MNFLWVTIVSAFVSVAANRLDRWWSIRSALSIKARLFDEAIPQRALRSTFNSFEPGAPMRSHIGLTVVASNKGGEDITISRVEAVLPKKHVFALRHDPEDGSPSRPEYTLESGGPRGRWSAPLGYEQIAEIESIRLCDGNDRTWNVPEKYVTNIRASARVALRKKEAEEAASSSSPPQQPQAKDHGDNAEGHNNPE